MLCIHLVCASAVVVQVQTSYGTRGDVQVKKIPIYSMVVMYALLACALAGLSKVESQQSSELGCVQQ